MGLGRLLIGMAFLIFAISLVPGMFGGALGELDAYVPSRLRKAAAAGGAGGESGLVWMKNQYREALDRARREGKLVLRQLHRLCLHQLPLDEGQHVHAAGDRGRAARTSCWWICTRMAPTPLRQQNQQLEDSKFKTIAIPFYAILDADGNAIATYPGATRDAAAYLAFLNRRADFSPRGASAPLSDLSALQALTLDGTPVDTTALEGKVVVVDFWATYCVPCLKEIPTFNRLHEQLADRGVVVLGVSMDVDGGAPLVESFLKQHPMKYRVALGSENMTGVFHVNQLPTTVVFDRHGKTLQRFEGYTPADKLESVVKTAL